MIDRFVKFEGSSNQIFRGRLRITLSPKNFFMLNEAAFEALGSPAAVEFYFDAHERKIGVKGCAPEVRYAFRVGKDRMCYIIHAGAFCRHNLIKTNRRVLFEEPEVRPDQMLVLDMAKTINVSRSFGPSKALEG